MKTKKLIGDLIRKSFGVLLILTLSGCAGFQMVQERAGEAVDTMTPEFVDTTVDTGAGIVKGFLNGFVNAVKAFLDGVKDASDSLKGLGDLIDAGNLLIGGAAVAAGG